MCYLWGRGEYGRLGQGDDCADKQRPVEVAEVMSEGTRVVDAALGGTHTCLLDEDGVVTSFGRNSLGRLGRVADGKARSIHWFAYDRVRVVNADP